jgi:hypothetical protein
MERHLRADSIARGRLWERTPPAELGLVFSAQALRFLIWTTRAKPEDTKGQWNPPPTELTAADLFLCYLAYTALRDTDVARVLQKQATFVGNALCRLAYPADFGDNQHCAGVDFTPWTYGVGACILEALQCDLAKKWQEAERRKANMKDGQEMRRLGTAQFRVLGRFLTAVEAAGRQDLARFLLQTAAALLTEDVTPALWVGSLESRGGRLADRAETHQAAMAFLRRMDEFRRWEAKARGVGYLDEGYAAAQLWKQDWERFGGESLYHRAHAIIRHLDPMNLFSGGRQS